MQLFKIRLETDTHPDSVPPCDSCEGCKAARERAMPALAALAILDKSLRKAALQIDFDPTTGRLNLTYPDGTKFGHVQIESLKPKTK